MKNKSLVFAAIILVCAFSPIAVKGQSLPHTFSANTAAKASEVNENFTYLLERFGTRKTTVNCGTSGTGSGINNALEQDYNHIYISGTCLENLDIDGSNSRHQVIILEGTGSNASDMIKDSSSGNSNVISVDNGSISLFVKNLTISGGKRGINAYLNHHLGVYDSKVENYSDIGIATWWGIAMEVKNVTVDGNNSGSLGIRVGGNSYATIENCTIQNNTEDGIALYSSSSSYIKDTISQNNGENGFEVQMSSHAYLWSGNSSINNGNNGIALYHNSSVGMAGDNTFSNNSHDGVHLSRSSSFESWGGVQTMSNNAHHGIGVYGSSALRLVEVNISGVNNTEYDGINAGLGASLEILKASITNVSNGIHLWGSKAEISNVTITGSTKEGISVNNNGMLDISNSTISGSTKEGIYISRGSTVDIDNSTISSNTKDGIEINRNSHVMVKNTTVSSNGDDGIHVSRYSYLDLRNTTISNNISNGIRVDRNATVDINDDGGTSASSPTTIQSNGDNGINAYAYALIEIDESKPVISGNTNYPISLGKQTHLTFWESDTRSISGTINCWTLFEPTARSSSLNYSDNASNAQQLFNYPVIEYFSHVPNSSTRPTVSSVCGEWYN